MKWLIQHFVNLKVKNISFSKQHYYPQRCELFQGYSGHPERRKEARLNVKNVRVLGLPVLFEDI